ncbi:hypothetical protein [Sorangium sp. So ce854]|uniref:hypothetical protein n=1 Tax=Sorangium sp. So ce854 TaxID=3133322 RepID=UPI003F600C37
MIHVECPPGTPWPRDRQIEAIVGIPTTIYISAEVDPLVRITHAPAGSQAELSGFSGSGLRALAPDLAGLYRLSIVAPDGVRVIELVASAAGVPIWQRLRYQDAYPNERARRRDQVSAMLRLLVNVSLA